MLPPLYTRRGEERRGEETRRDETRGEERRRDERRGDERRREETRGDERRWKGGLVILEVLSAALVVEDPDFSVGDAGGAGGEGNRDQRGDDDET